MVIYCGKKITPNLEVFINFLIWCLICIKKYILLLGYFLHFERYRNKHKKIYD